MPRIRHVDVKKLKHENAPRVHFYPFAALKKPGDFITWDNFDWVALSKAFGRFKRSDKAFPVKLETTGRGLAKVTRLSLWP